MKLGKTYWSIHTDSFKLKETLPKQEYLLKLKEIRLEVKQVLNNKLDYSTEKAANDAYNKLPDHLKQWSMVTEVTFVVANGALIVVPAENVCLAVHVFATAVEAPPNDNSFALPAI